MTNAVRILQLKVKRAEEHFTHLENLLSGRSDPIHTPHLSKIHYNPERQTTQYETVVEAPSPEWAIVVGDVIHQLRSALDHLICALAIRRNKASVCADYKLNFPILKDPNDFKADRRVSQGHFERLIGIDELTEVERTQPYKRHPGSPTTDTLFILSQLDNIDKHRAIIVLDNRLGIRGPGQYLTIERHASFQAIGKQIVKTSTERFRINFPSTIPPNEVNMDDFSVHIVFAETGVCDNVPIGTMTREMITNVESVIDRFERFF